MSNFNGASDSEGIPPEVECTSQKEHEGDNEMPHRLLRAIPPDVQDVAAKLLQSYHNRMKLRELYCDEQIEYPEICGTQPQDEVVPEISAEQKIIERKLRAQPPIPHIFQHIIRNDNARREILEKGANMTQNDWRLLKELTLDKKKSLRPAAEKALQRSDPGGF